MSSKTALQVVCEFFWGGKPREDDASSLKILVCTEYFLWMKTFSYVSIIPKKVNKDSVMSNKYSTLNFSQTGIYLLCTYLHVFIMSL